jgi:hypothetical protein
MVEALAVTCIYTIKESSKLEQIIRLGETHVEARRSTRDKQLLEAAKTDGKRLPIADRRTMASLG